MNLPKYRTIISEYSNIFLTPERSAFNHIKTTARLFIGLAAMALPSHVLSAQQDTVKPESAFQNDPSVQVDTLPNGIVYYLKQNPWPSGEVAVRLVVKAGYLYDDSTGTSLVESTAQAVLKDQAEIKPDIDYQSTLYRYTVNSDSASVWNGLSTLHALVTQPITDTSSGVISFHRKWYRPDNMAIVVVGDISADKAGAWLNHIFRDIAAPDEPLAQRPSFGRPASDSTVTRVFTDSTASDGSVEITYYVAPVDQSAEDNFNWGITNSIFANILSQRIGELKGRSNGVITRGNAGVSSSGPNGAWLVIRAGFTTGSADSALMLVAREIASVSQNGFTNEEVVLWREMLLGNYRSGEAPPPDRSELSADQYAAHFIMGEYYATQSQQKPWVRDIVNNLSRDGLMGHGHRWFESKSRSIEVGLPGAAGLITPDNKDSLEELYTAIINKYSSQPALVAVPDSNFRIVDLEFVEGKKFEEVLKKEIAKAEAIGYLPVVEFGAIWCLPCRLVDVSLGHPLMRDAFDKVYLIRVDIDVWEEKLQEASFPIQSVPAFFATSREGTPTGAVKYGANSGDLDTNAGEMNNSFAENAAPGFKAFFEQCREEFEESKKASKGP